MRVSELTRKKKVAFSFLFILFLVVGARARATSVTLPNPLQYESFEELADHLMQVFTVIGSAFVGLAVVIGAFFILTSGGEPGKWQKGRDILLYALLGLTILILARGITAFIRYLFGTKESTARTFIS